jgi:predicted Zn-dependent peptidase
MERKVIIEELNMCFDSPQSRVDTLIDEVMWPDQALGRDVLGRKETITGVDRTAIVSYLSNHYLPSNTVIGVAGDILHDEVLGAITEALGSWKDDVMASWTPAKDSENSPRVITERRKTEQAHLCLSVEGIPHNHPDRFTLDLLNLILGEGMSSRLFLEIREKLGLAYDVHSHISHYHDSGSVSVCAGVDPKQIERVIEAILIELAKLKDEVVSETEIVKAKELGKGRLMLRMEDTRSVAGWIGGQDLLTGNIRTVDEVVSLLDAVSAADLQRVARDIFREEKLRLALVAPRPNEDRLEKLLKI